MNDLDAADPNIQTAILDVLAEGVSAAVLLYDKNDRVVFASQQYAALSLLPKDLLVPGARMRDILAAQYDLELGMAGDPAARRGRSRDDCLAERVAGLWKERSEDITRPDGERWLSVVKRRLPSGYGVCVIKDISEQKKREEQWRLDIERVRVTEEVLDNLPFSLTVKDRHGTFVAVNKASCALRDLPAEDILGHKGADINPTDLEERVDPMNRQVFEDGQPMRIPERIVRSDGSTVVGIVNKYRIGKPGRYYLVTVIQDVSNMLADTGADHFLVPLVRPEELRHSDFSRGRSLTASAQAAEISLPPAKVLVVTDDPDTEQQALELLTRSGVDVSAVSSSDELALFLQLAGEVDVRIDLVVTEAAMPQDCRDVAEAHGIPVLDLPATRFGQDLASAVGAGLVKAAQDRVPSVADGWGEAPGANQEIDVLVAEDNEVNQIVFSQIIESFGYRYAVAADGEEAVRFWRERKPRLVLMDVTLPKLTGFEAATAIRVLEGGKSHVPVVGVLAQAFDRDREVCMAAGMDDVILKPISPEALEGVFRKFLAQEGEEGQSRRSA
jgi:PAS domain S-box-containing protein